MVIGNKKINKDPKHNGEDYYFDNCPLCQTMKKEGVTMQWVSDECDYDLSEDKFSITPIVKN